MEYVKCEDIAEFFANNKRKLANEMILLAEGNGLKLVLDISASGFPIIKVMDSEYIDIISNTCSVIGLEQEYRDCLKDFIEEDEADNDGVFADDELREHIIEENETYLKDTVELFINEIVEEPISDVVEFMESKQCEGFIDALCEQLTECGFTIYRPMIVESDGEEIFVEYPYEEYTFNDKGE